MEASRAGAIIRATRRGGDGDLAPGDFDASPAVAVPDLRDKPETSRQQGPRKRSTFERTSEASTTGFER